MRPMSPLLLCLVVLACLGCGDDDAPTDAGTDAAEPPVDTGPGDGGPAAYLGLCDPAADPGPFPAPDAWANAGPGGPATTFSEDERYETCAYLDGGETDVDHHNLVTMYDGYLLMPWAPESGNGGLTLWDFSSPCEPVVHGRGLSPTMRESHSIGFSSLGGEWAVVDSIEGYLEFGAGGIQFWDLSDTSAPEPVANVSLEGFFYPDAYARVALSVFWQVPFVYVGAADNGVYIVDATDPTNAQVVGQYSWEPTLRVGQVQVVGNLLVATAAEGPRTALLDVSDPVNPQPIPGGDFVARDASGEPRGAYFTNFANGNVYYANKDGGGGVLVYDVSDPQNPTYLGENISDGNGGYVFVKDELAFVGESNFAAIYDLSGMPEISEVVRLDLEGDLDTMTPIGNVAVLSVDADAVDGEGSSVIPYALEPDERAPAVTFVWPPDGASAVPVTSRVGVSFGEMVDVKSAFEGSVRLTETDSGARVAGVVSAQENLVSFHPFCPLEAGTTYTLEIPAGGVTDFNGNSVGETFTASFTTE
jgi:hypothetical protein